MDYWRRWLAQSSYRGRWREMVERSALALKLLTYETTGTIVAAPTCSLPEELGGQRNWDYRYTWIRDAAFTLYALLRIGFTDEASRFMGWIEDCTQDLNPDGSMQIMYGIDGRHDLKEETLDHLEGYKGSRPVRIGNGAYGNFEWISTVNSSTQYTSTINTAPRSPTTSGPYSKTGQLGL